MSITGAALLSVSTFEFVHIGSEFSAALSVVTVTRYQQEHSRPTTKLRCDSFMKRILSSLLFSGVLSIPGNAAATRRNSWKQIRGASVKVSLRHTKIGVGLGHHLSIPGLNWQLKLDVSHSIFNVIGEARSCLNANTRFSCLRCLYEFRSPNPTANGLRLCTRWQNVNNKNTGSSSAAVQAEKVWFRAEDAEFISTLIYHLHSGRKTLWLEKPE